MSRAARRSWVGLAAHHRLQLGDELQLPAEREPALRAGLEGGQAQLFEPADLALGEVLVGDVGQRVPAPQGERVVESLHGAGVVAVARGPAAIGDRAGEALGVELARRGRQPVAARVALEGAGRAGRRQRLAQAGDRDVDAPLPRRPAGLVPERVEQLVRRHDAVGVHEQEGEQRDLARAAGGHACPAVGELDGPEDAVARKEPGLGVGR